MAKGMYASIGGVTKKIKKNYAVVGGVTKKIKRMYAVVDGKTRLIFSGGEIEYTGDITITTLTYDKLSRIATATVNNNALFFGGLYKTGTGWDSYDEEYDTYYMSTQTYKCDSSLTFGTLGIFGDATYGVYAAAGASVGDYAIFHSGYTNVGSTGEYKQTLNAYGTYNSYIYDSSLTKSTTTRLFNANVRAAHMFSASHVGNYAIFAGGVSKSSYSAKAYAVDSSLTGSKLGDLSLARQRGGSATLNNCAIFFGGCQGVTAGRENIDVYNSSLTHTVSKKYSTSVIDGRYDNSGATVGNHALFAGGTTNYASMDPKMVWSVDTSNTISTVSSGLQAGRVCLASASLPGYAIFTGGKKSGSSCAYVDLYDESLTHTVLADMKYARSEHCGVSLGDTAIFFGGTTSGTGNTFDVYSI